MEGKPSVFSARLRSKQKFMMFFKVLPDAYIKQDVVNVEDIKIM